MNTFARRIMVGTLAGLVVVGAAGCGNKGPLVLPERPGTDAPETASPEIDAGADGLVPGR